MERQWVQFGPAGFAAECSRVPESLGVALVAHGGTGSRLAVRRRVARVLHGHHLCTLLLERWARSATNDPGPAPDARALVPALGEALNWLQEQPDFARLRVGLFAVATSNAAVLQAAAQRPGRVGAVVSSGGPPDLAAMSLAGVQAPTLIIVGGRDTEALALQREAMRQLQCSKRLEVVPGATRDFDEPGTLEAASHLAGAWFATHLPEGGVR